MIVPDALEDERFRDTSLVAGPPYTRFYAGFPLSMDGIHILGTLCVVDTKPRHPPKRSSCSCGGWEPSCSA